MTTLTKTIEEFPNYTISTEGVVTNITTGRELKTAGNGRGYLILTLSHEGKRKTCLIHRLVAQAFIPNPLNLPIAEHRDRNRQNNTLNNLRWATVTDNNQNLSKQKDTISQYIGISWCKKTNKWRARIHFNSKRLSLGSYSSEAEAAIAYDYAAYDAGFLHHNNLVYSLVAV